VIGAFSAFSSITMSPWLVLSFTWVMVVSLYQGIRRARERGEHTSIPRAGWVDTAAGGV
jgi:hypothetical protein